MTHEDSEVILLDPVNQVETVSLNEIRQHFSASIAKVLQRTLKITKREYDEYVDDW